MVIKSISHWGLACLDQQVCPQCFCSFTQHSIYTIVINLIKGQGKFGGIWHGFYMYDNPTDGPTDYQVPFTATLVQDKDGKLTGTAQDDADEGGVEEPAVVVGQITNDAIGFEKRMPVLRVDYDDGTQVTDADSGYTVFYKGSYNYTKNKFFGTWSIPAETIQSGNELIEVEETTGTWEMERQ